MSCKDFRNWPVVEGIIVTVMVVIILAMISVPVVKYLKSLGWL